MIDELAHKYVIENIAPERNDLFLVFKKIFIAGYNAAQDEIKRGKDEVIIMVNDPFVSIVYDQSASPDSTCNSTTYAKYGGDLPDTNPLPSKT